MLFSTFLALGLAPSGKTTDYAFEVDIISPFFPLGMT